MDWSYRLEILQPPGFKPYSALGRAIVQSSGTFTNEDGVDPENYNSDDDDDGDEDEEDP